MAGERRRRARAHGAATAGRGEAAGGDRRVVEPASFTGSARGIAPLHLEQLLRFTREQGSGAPTRLADLMALRVERLSADARRVLQAIAVYGDDSGDDAVTKLVPEDTNLSSALSVLLRAGG